MLIIKKDPDDIASHEITPKGTYLNRRRFLVGGAGAALIGGGYLFNKGRSAQAAEVKQKLVAKPSPYTLESLGGEKLNTYKEVTSYNNFYEFGTDKSDPADNAGSLKPRPWSVVLEGECKKPQTVDIEKILKLAPLEDRVYRFRCVEAWSMVIPWVGYSLSELLKIAEPTSKAKYVEFLTLMAPDQMPGQAVPVLSWPYREGLRMDEAMHPLTLCALGLYGETLPNQNGAPVRLVVPWKYGFKSIKSIVKIRFVENQPETSWNRSQPSEYGFYSNVNPEVDHPRWTQATERRIGELRRRKTLPFNGYATQVNKLYANLDLRKNF